MASYNKGGVSLPCAGFGGVMPRRSRPLVISRLTTGRLVAIGIKIKRAAAGCFLRISARGGIIDTARSARETRTGAAVSDRPIRKSIVTRTGERRRNHAQLQKHARSAAPSKASSRIITGLYHSPAAAGAWSLLQVYLVPSPRMCGCREAVGLSPAGEVGGARRTRIAGEGGAVYPRRLLCLRFSGNP